QCNLLSSGISFLLAVGTFFTGSGNFSWQSPRDNRNKEAPRRTIPVEADENPSNYALMAYASSGSSSFSGSDNEDVKLLKLDVMLRDNELVELRKKFEKAKKERDELKHTLEKL
nr:hypothetical protein [Tanacetum cinerariifolium]